MPRTRSEELFERFCSERSIPFIAVTTGANRTPDYDVNWNGSSISVEVKQLNRDDAPQRSGEVRVYSTTPGEHIRRKINKAGGQIRAAAARARPTLLIIYNNIYRRICVYSEPYDFLVAMYGLQNVVLGVQKNEPAYIKGHRFGPRRKMTADMNTSISALACLRENREDQLLLDVYHNAHATIQLDPNSIRAKDVKHFVIPKGAEEFTYWEEIA